MWEVYEFENFSSVDFDTSGPGLKSYKMVTIPQIPPDFVTKL